MTSRGCTCRRLLRPLEWRGFGTVPEFLTYWPIRLLSVVVSLGAVVGFVLVCARISIVGWSPAVDQALAPWDRVFRVSLWSFLVGACYVGAFYFGLLLYTLHLAWRRFRKSRPIDERSLCPGVAPSDEIHPWEEESPEPEPPPSETCPHVGIRVCLSLCKRLVAFHRKRLHCVRGKRLTRLLDNVRRCTTRAELESFTGMPVCSIRTRRLRELHGEYADHILIEEYDLCDYAVLLGFRDGQVCLIAGRVKPSKWDEALRRQGVDVPEASCLEIRSARAQDGDASLIEWL